MPPLAHISILLTVQELHRIAITKNPFLASVKSPGHRVDTYKSQWYKTSFVLGDKGVDNQSIWVGVWNAEYR